jgi:hypothetical protein
MSRCCLKFAAFALLLSVLPSSPAAAFTGLGIGVKGGVVTDYKNPNLKVSDFEFDDLKFFGAFMTWGSSSFALELGAEYYWDKQQLSLLDSEVEVDARDFYVGATAKYYFAFPLIQPFLGAGLAAHRFTYKYQGPLDDFPEVTVIIPSDDTRLGYHLVVGARLGVPAFPFDLFLEGKIGRVNTDPEDTKFTVVSGGITLGLP